MKTEARVDVVLIFCVNLKIMSSHARPHVRMCAIDYINRMAVFGPIIALVLLSNLRMHHSCQG